MELAIQVKAGTEGALVGFPFSEGQYLDREENDQADDTIWVYVELGNAKDTTAMQEQALNTNPNVLYYSIL